MPFRGTACESLAGVADLPIEGSVAPGFEPVAEAFRRAFDDFGETGGAVAGYHEGRSMVDLWAGEAAPGSPGPATRPCRCTR